MLVTLAGLPHLEAVRDPLPVVTPQEARIMLEKLIIRLEQLKAFLELKNEQKRRNRSLKSAKVEINRLSKLRVL